MVGPLSRDAELAELARLIGRHSAEAKAMIRDSDETEARLRGST